MKKLTIQGDPPCNTKAVFYIDSNHNKYCYNDAIEGDKSRIKKLREKFSAPGAPIILLRRAPHLSSLFGRVPFVV
jgi:hypothetical protein